MTELTADSPSAGAGDATATIAAVSSGPPTNDSSTIAASSANAVVSSSGRSASRRGQSGRMTAPMGGNAMPPTSDASTTNPTGACPSATATISASPTACASARGARTSRCPRRSISRLMYGPEAPTPMAIAPAAAPAAPYEYPSWRMSSTIASALIPSGIRASTDSASIGRT